MVEQLTLNQWVESSSLSGDTKKERKAPFFEDNRGANVFPPYIKKLKTRHHAAQNMRTDNELQGVTLLGNRHVQYSDQYNPEVLETFVNKHPENEYLVTFNCPEFTTLCPKTGQPDFGHLYISYIPRERMVESKSLKLYLFSFRNHGDFHEDCVNIIMKDLVRLMDPKYLEVTGYFLPRGGISIYPFANYADKEHQELKKQRLIEQLKQSSINR